MTKKRMTAPIDNKSTMPMTMAAMTPADKPLSPPDVGDFACWGFVADGVVVTAFVAGVDGEDEVPGTTTVAVDTEPPLASLSFIADVTTDDDI